MYFLIVSISNSGPPYAKAAFNFPSTCPGIFTNVSLNNDVNLIFLLLLSNVAIIIESALQLHLTFLHLFQVIKHLLYHQLLGSHNRLLFLMDLT